MSLNPLVSFQPPASAGGPVVTDSFTQGMGPSSKPKCSRFKEENVCSKCKGFPPLPLGSGRGRVPVVHDPSRHMLIPWPDPVPGLSPSREGCYLSNKMVCKIFKSLQKKRLMCSSAGAFLSPKVWLIITASPKKKIKKILK